MTDNARFDAEKRKTVRKVATASFFCNFIEWFDYATYSYFAVVIAQVFFPNDDPALALIQTFAVFASVVFAASNRRYLLGQHGRQEGP